MIAGEKYRIHSTALVGYADVEIMDVTEDAVTFRRLKDNVVVEAERETLNGMVVKPLEGKT